MPDTKEIPGAGRLILPPANLLPPKPLVMDDKLATSWKNNGRKSLAIPNRRWNLQARIIPGQSINIALGHRGGCC